MGRVLIRIFPDMDTILRKGAWMKQADVPLDGGGGFLDLEWMVKEIWGLDEYSVRSFPLSSLLPCLADDGA
jgi:hypothetical protein